MVTQICIYVLNTIFSTFFITGQVLDSETKYPLSNVKIQCYDGIKAITQLTPIPIDGQINIKLNNFSGTHVTIKLLSNNYYVLRKTIPLNKNEIDIGDVLMIPIPTIKLSKILILNTDDTKKSKVDFFVESKSTNSIIVKSISITGNKLNYSNCLDSSPALTIEIKDSLNIKEAKITDNTNTLMDKIKINGGIEILPCDQMRLNYYIGYLFSIKPSETFKIRAVLPRTVKYNNKLKNVDLQDWYLIQLMLELEDGTKIYSPLNK